MKSFDNHGNLVSESNTSRTSDGKVITSNTIYNTDNGRPVAQNISVRDQQGKVVGHALIPATTALSGQTVNDVIKARAQAVGFAAGEVSGHSLRRGFVTTAIENDKDIFAVQAQTGHKSIDMLAQYKGQVDAFARGAGKGLL